MSTRDKYVPDYSKLYPGVTITPGVMRVLRQTDRKMQYFEFDLKAERRRKKKQTVTVLPAREDSLDRLTENNARRYLPEELTVEDAIIEQDELERLREALKRLEPEERELVKALFFDEKTEREYAESLGISQKAVNKRWHKTRLKLKNFLIFKNFGSQNASWARKKVRGVF